MYGFVPLSTQVESVDVLLLYIDVKSRRFVVNTLPPYDNDSLDREHRTGFSVQEIKYRSPIIPG